MDRQERHRFAHEIFVFFGFETQFKQAMNELLEPWTEFMTSHGLYDHPELARQYRDFLYTRKVKTPFDIIPAFEEVIRSHPHIRKDYLEQLNNRYERCDFCEGHGIVMIPMVNRGGEENMRAFYCDCTKGKTLYGGIPAATGEMLRWRLQENRRELEKSRQYAQRLGLDADRCTFADMWAALKSRHGSASLFTNVSDLNKPLDNYNFQ